MKVPISPIPQLSTGHWDSFPTPSMATLNMFFYTVGSYAALQAFREWSLANKRFYLEHLHLLPKTKLQALHYHRMKLVCCLGAMLGCAIRSAIQVLPPVGCVLAMEYAFGAALRNWFPGYREHWNWLHLHTVLAGTATGWLFWRRLAGRHRPSIKFQQSLPTVRPTPLRLDDRNQGLYYGTLIGTTLCLGRLYRE